MMMNPGIILSARQPDFVNTLARSTQAAQMQNEVRQQNALRDFMAENGPQVFAGNQNALSQLSRISPDAAFSAATNRQNLDFSAERLRMLRDGARQAAADRAAQMSAEERKAAAERMQGVLRGAAHFYQQGDQEGYAAWLQQNGLDPNQYQFAAFPAHLASATGTIDALVDIREYTQGPERTIQMTGAQIIESRGFGPDTGIDPNKVYNVKPDGSIPGLDRAPMSVNVGDQYYLGPDGKPRTVNPEEIEPREIPGDVSGALGSVGAVLGGLNAIGEFALLGQAAPEAGKARDALKSLSVRTMLGLAEEFPGRPSNLTRERIEQITIKPTDLLAGPETSLNKTREILAIIENSIAAANSVMLDNLYDRKAKIEAQTALTQLSQIYAEYKGLETALASALADEDQGDGGMEVPADILERMKAYE